MAVLYPGMIFQCWLATTPSFRLPLGYTSQLMDYSMTPIALLTEFNSFSMKVEYITCSDTPLTYSRAIGQKRH